MIGWQFFAIILAVSVAGGLGSVLRLFLGRWVGKLPWGILVGNVLASLWVGVMSNSANWAIAVILISGFAGGLSTFSGFAAQTVDFFSRGRVTQGILNILANLLLSSTAVVIGQALSAEMLKWS